MFGATDESDDFWDHPSLLAFCEPSQLQSANNQNQNTIVTQNNQSRKRTFQEMNNSDNRANNGATVNHTIEYPNKQQRTALNAKKSVSSNHYSFNSQSSQSYSQSTSAQSQQSQSILNIPPNDNTDSPLCTAHNLPMVKFRVRKNNNNFGRWFWTCAQQPKCRTFQWDDQLQIKDKRNKNKNAVSNAVEYMGTLTVNTELICLDPEPLVEVTVWPESNLYITDIKSCRNATFSAESRKWIVPFSEHRLMIDRLQQSCRREKRKLISDIIPHKIQSTIKKWTKNNNASAQASNATALKNELSSMNINDESSNRRYIDGLPRKLRESLYDFQTEGVTFAISKEGRCLIADEMGLGKSIQAIAIAYHYRNDWPLLIVTPSSLRLTWRSEILKWLVDESSVLPTHINVVSSSKDKMLDYTAFNKGESTQPKPVSPITIISYGLLTRKQAEINGFSPWNMIICDESHALKNPQTKRCKVILPIIAKTRRALLLSGTPTNNRPAEIHSQIDALRKHEFMGFKEFTMRYCEGRQGKFGWEALGALHLKELHTLLKYRVMIRRLKADVLDQLPDKIRRVVVIDIATKDIKKLKAKMKQQEGLRMKISAKSECSVADEGSVDDKSMGLMNLRDAGMMALYRDTGLAKIKGVCEYIQDLFESGEKFLIFGHHLDALNGIEDFVRDTLRTEYMRIDGSTKEIDRDRNVKHFQSKDSMRVAILSITAAGTGLTLTQATTVVFAELFWSPSALMQCEDRAHRISQKSVVNIVYLLGRNSLDDKLWPMVKTKMEVVSKTLTGKDTQLEIDSYREHYLSANSPNAKKNSTDVDDIPYRKRKGGAQRSIFEMLTPSPTTSKHT